MILTIDTTHALNDTDRALLRALLEGTPGSTPGHTPGPPRGRSAADLGAAVLAGAGRPGANPAAFARGAVSAQPGVTLTESTRDDEDPAA